jgi:glucokinase
MDYAIGIDVGATNIKTVAITPDGRLLARNQEPTTETDPAWAERVRAQIARLSQAFGTPARLGIAAPGLAAPDARSIAWMQGRLASVQGLDWTAYLGAKRLIPVLNDAHAALLGEIWQGAAQGSRNVLMLTLGTGVGGAAVVDGHLLRGHLGRAGHLGHICLNLGGPKDIVNTPGSLEDAIGDCTIRQRSGGRFPSTLELIRAREAGDAEAAEIWERAVHALACGLISLINAFDPEKVLLGGGIVQSGAALWTPLERFLDEYEWRPTGRKVPIVSAALGEWAGAYGAAANALRATANDSPD